MARINVNHANINELEQAFHSRERAHEVMNQRELTGDFKDWDDLRAKLHGMSGAQIQALRDAGVTVGNEPHTWTVGPQPPA